MTLCFLLAVHSMDAMKRFRSWNIRISHSNEPLKGGVTGLREQSQLDLDRERRKEGNLEMFHMRKTLAVAIGAGLLLTGCGNATTNAHPSWMTVNKATKTVNLTIKGGSTRNN